MRDEYIVRFACCTGLDRLLHEDAIASRVRGRRFGLVAHPASVTRELAHVRAVLERIGARPSIVFGPEHGYGGEAQDMIGVKDARDRDGTPVRSLYGDAYDDLSPRAEDLAGLDLLVVDLQDVGSRYYTFVWTAVLAVRACAARGVPVLVLDRPNPIGGVTREGRTQDAALRSFVGLEPIPVRHGLTLGEIVAWRADVEGLAKDAVTSRACTAGRARRTRRRGRARSSRRRRTCRRTTPRSSTPAAA